MIIWLYKQGTIGFALQEGMGYCGSMVYGPDVRWAKYCNGVDSYLRVPGVPKIKTMNGRPMTYATVNPFRATSAVASLMTDLQSMTPRKDAQKVKQKGGGIHAQVQFLNFETN